MTTLKTIRNWFLGILFVALCMVGFAAPVIWPETYSPMYYPVYGTGTPMVQHHVEFCQNPLLIIEEYCETDSEIFIV